LLAAGTLASTKLALKVLKYSSKIKILSSPTAAFLLWLPSMFAQSRQTGFGLGQLAYTLDVGENLKAFGSTFSTNGIPISEFARHVPLRRSNSIDILSVLMSSCVVGNVFLPGHLTKVSAQLLDDTLQIDGSYPDSLSSIMKNISSNLRRSLFKMGGIMLPGSFTVGMPGGDIHYAGTLPMRESPVIGESNAFGELAGAKNLYVVDGAALPILPEKSHTLTIMANADRIGRSI
jgi:choline dehydrogenase-like flavoprotein